MGLLLLEALGAMVLLILIVWWTMFSGRKKGEPARPAEPQDSAKETTKGSGAEGNGDGLEK